MKAATVLTVAAVVNFIISIHAAREGGDERAARLNPRNRISIHAAREGGDDDTTADDMSAPISIHAAREGGDQRRAFY